jgi:hypothetical protein
MWLLKQIGELFAIGLMVIVGGTWLMIGFWFIQSWWGWISNIFAMLFLFLFLALIGFGIWGLIERRDYFYLAILIASILPLIITIIISVRKERKKFTS